jgi:hypothetical protein
MEDIIGIKVLNSRQKSVGFMTYGRLWDAVDDSELKDAIRANLTRFGLEPSNEIQMCRSLKELQSCNYFYEGLIWFAWHPIPFGPQYEEWRRQKQVELLSGESIYYLGELAEEPSPQS